MKEENLLRRVLGPWLTVNHHQTHVATTAGLRLRNCKYLLNKIKMVAESKKVVLNTK